MDQDILGPDGVKGVIDSQSKAELLDGDGKRIKVRIACANCGRVAKAITIDSDEPRLLRNIKCQRCPIVGFDWEYKPSQVGGHYVYITASASFGAAEAAMMIRHNNRKIDISNR